MKIEDVVIIGGGPVGLLMGLSLHKRGIPFTLIEKRTEIISDSRSLGIHPVSLEIFDQLEITNAFLEQGLKVTEGIAHSGKKELGRLAFDSCPKPHNYILLLAQSKTEEILRKELTKKAPDSMIFGAEVTDLDQHGDMVSITFIKDGKSHSADIGYAIGCDGKDSFTRRAMKIGFQGHNYPDTYIMGDFRDDTDFGNTAMLYLTKQGLVESIPLPESQRRWVVKMNQQENNPTAELLAGIVEERTSNTLDSATNSMISSFGTQFFLADEFVKDRVVLAGDAAHVVSPIGGQGMNLGWMDAWHLANVMSFCRGISKDLPIADLFIYEAKQKPIARKVAKRAEWNMKMGRSSVFPFFKNMMVRRLSKPPFGNRLARRFTMRGLE